MLGIIRHHWSIAEAVIKTTHPLYLRSYNLYVDILLSFSCVKARLGVAVTPHPNRDSCNHPWALIRESTGYHIYGLVWNVLYYVRMSLKRASRKVLCHEVSW